MIEALWSVEFVSNVPNIPNAGAGVVVFETERIVGGDASFTYVGSYEIKNGKMIANIKCTNFSGLQHSVFGPIKEFNLHLEGMPKWDIFYVNGYMVENPAMKIGIRLTRRAELP